MKAGTLIRLFDGRVGRVVYHGLDGYGIKLGSAPVDIETIMRGDSGLFDSSPHDEELQQWIPDLMLKRGEYEIAEEPNQENPNKESPHE